MTLRRDTSYPVRVEVGDQSIELSHMSSKDTEALLRFAAGLSEHDLLFLRRDIRQLDVIEDWLMDLDSGGVLTILAKAGDEVVGETTIHADSMHWSSHVAELRVVVAQSARGRGLSKLLTGEALKVAVRSGLKKVIARMTVDQKGAIALFRGLGFEREALMRDHVMDLEEKTHDLIVMSLFVEGNES
jgi:RimJ/RimL family protein N-acetyltransferase